MVANCTCDSTFIQEDYDNLIFESANIINFKEIKKIFLSNLFIFNLEVLKCYNLVIDKKIIVTNIGFYCLSFMLFLQFIFFIIYLIKKLKSLQHYMKHIKDNKNNINVKNNKEKKNQIHHEKVKMN